MDEPVVTVIVLNYNGVQHDHLPRCMESLARQTYPDIQIIVVDNHSTDTSCEHIKTHYPKIQLIQSEINLGYCGGNNLGYAHASGDFILFANNDIRLDPDAIKMMVEAACKHPKIGSISPKLVRPKGERAGLTMLDSAGLTLRIDFTLKDRGIGEVDIGQYEQPVLIFGVCGAAAFYSREALEAVKDANNQIWDEAFYAYYEDGDLAWRVQRKGYNCVYSPEAIIEHHRGGTEQSKFFAKQDRFKTHTIKNRYLMLIKNLPTRMAIFYLPAIMVREILIWGYLVLHPHLLIDVLRTLAKVLPRALEKRKSCPPDDRYPFIRNSKEIGNYQNNL